MIAVPFNFIHHFEMIFVLSTPHYAAIQGSEARKNSLHCTTLLKKS